MMVLYPQLKAKYDGWCEDVGSIMPAITTGITCMCAKVIAALPVADKMLLWPQQFFLLVAENQI